MTTSGLEYSLPGHFPAFLQKLMEHDWRGQLASTAAEKIGHADAQLDIAAARIAPPSDLTGHQNGTLLSFLNQIIWTMERANTAGYDVPVGFCHGVLHCPKTVEIRATHFSAAELLRLIEPLPQAPHLRLGFPLVPEFRGVPPPGCCLVLGEFWCAQVGINTQEAFSEGE
eukprot:426405-Pyramimonas_sp.AAC.1